MSGLEIIVLGAYGLMLIELVFLPVPSEASTYQLLTAKKQNGANLSEALLRIQGMSLGRRLGMFLLPTSLTLGAFLLPLLQIFSPGLENYLILLSFFKKPIFYSLAAGLILLGSAITLISVLEIRRGTKPLSYWEAPGSSLGVQGVFQWSRNPGLVGNYLLFLGLFLFLPTLAMACGFSVYLLNMHQRILLEESQLEARFGESYRDYKRRVPRYFGY